MSNVSNWCLIESDPGVFTELIRGFGVKGVQVEEIYSLDDDSFEKLKPIHGLIFLFKWRAGDEPGGQLAPYDNIFFAQQVISNACATQALINLISNSTSPDIDMSGSALEEFIKFTRDFDPPNRGLALSNSDSIRKVHNSFGRQHYVELYKTGKASKEENFHFITYVPVNGKVYELDGLREAPILIGDIPEGDDWLNVVKPTINKRIQKYSEGEVHFNLMAVISDRKAKCEKRLAELAECGMESDEMANEIYSLQTIISDEEYKTRMYKMENNRRRHNYTPFIVELLKILAKDGKLVPLVEKSLEQVGEKKPKLTKTN